MNAEAAYMFRHAVLREAAYQLQMPADRARLHAAAFGVLEELAGGRPPEEDPLPGVLQLAFHSHPTDVFAAELAEHARIAPDDASLKDAARLYLVRAAEHSERVFQGDAEALWRRHAALAAGLERAESLRRAAAAAL